MNSNGSTQRNRRRYSSAGCDRSASVSPYALCAMHSPRSRSASNPAASAAACRPIRSSIGRVVAERRDHRPDAMPARKGAIDEHSGAHAGACRSGSGVHRQLACEMVVEILDGDAAFEQARRASRLAATEMSSAVTESRWPATRSSSVMRDTVISSPSVPRGAAAARRRSSASPLKTSKWLIRCTRRSRRRCGRRPSAIARAHPPRAAASRCRTQRRRPLRRAPGLPACARCSSTVRSASDASLPSRVRCVMRSRNVATLALKRTITKGIPRSFARARNSWRCQRLRNAPSMMRDIPRRMPRLAQPRTRGTARLSPRARTGRRRSGRRVDARRRGGRPLRSTSVRTRTAPIRSSSACAIVRLPQPDSPCVMTIAGCGLCA